MAVVAPFGHANRSIRWRRPASWHERTGTVRQTAAELEGFPVTVYREVPEEARSYRYYRTDRNVVVVDPADRHVIEIID